MRQTNDDAGMVFQTERCVAARLAWYHVCMHPYVLEWHRPADEVNKSPDWYWALGIIACAGIIVAFLFDNVLLATIFGLGAIVVLLITRLEPQDTVCRLDHKDITINDTVYSLHDLDGYHIDEKNGELVLRFLTGEFLMPVVVVHIPDEYLEEIDLMMRSVVPRKRINDTFTHQVLEIFGI
jgi:hypothetical protein